LHRKRTLEIKAISEKPGFRAVSLERTSTDVAPLALSYIEQQGAPVLYVFCVPVH